jgi:hypothetical protein
MTARCELCGEGYVVDDRMCEPCLEGYRDSYMTGRVF